MKWKFVEKETLGGGWSTVVLRAGIPFGHIRQNAATGEYRYNSGRSSQLAPILSGYDLEELKAKIMAQL
jgi:hypothetical protein